MRELFTQFDIFVFPIWLSNNEKVVTCVIVRMENFRKKLLDRIFFCYAFKSFLSSLINDWIYVELTVVAENQREISWESGINYMR